MTPIALLYDRKLVAMLNFLRKLSKERNRLFSSRMSEIVFAPFLCNAFKKNNFLSIVINWLFQIRFLVDHWFSHIS